MPWDLVKNAHLGAKEQACFSQAGDSSSTQRFASAVFLKGEELAQRTSAALRELILKDPKGVWPGITEQAHSLAKGRKRPLRDDATHCSSDSKQPQQKTCHLCEKTTREAALNLTARTG